MKLIIHDLSRNEFISSIGKEISEDPEGINRLKDSNSSEEIIIIDKDWEHQDCIGCFGCWIKTPGKCVIKDSLKNMGELLSEAEEVVIISAGRYGGYSPFIKNVLDRSISYLLPVFKMINREVHHQKRYKRGFRLSVLFYKPVWEEREKEIARELVKANSINFHTSNYRVLFFEKICDIRKEHLGA